MDISLATACDTDSVVQIYHVTPGYHGDVHHLAFYHLQPKPSLVSVSELVTSAPRFCDKSCNIYRRHAIKQLKVTESL